MSSDAKIPFDNRLRAALRDEASRFRPLTDPARIEHAFATRPLVSSRIATLAAIGITLVILVAALIARGSLNPGTAAVAPGAPAPSASARPSDAPIGLADCQIGPADASLAFAGWTTLAVLHVSGGVAAPGQPVYALVTRGMVEWIGWDRSKGGMYPRPIGRMGCVFDPTTSLASLVGVPMEWQPPKMIDGCPVSAERTVGGVREIGGPGAWLVAPTSTASWYVGRDFKYLMFFHLTRPAAPNQTITAWAHILGPYEAVEGTLSDSPYQSVPVPRTGPVSEVFVNLEFTMTGCWVINLALDGSVVGSAILPIGAGSGQATPQPAATNP
jgi:hypothetical protein